MNDFTNKIIQGNNLDILSLFSNNSIDNFITDVPYALCDINGLDMIKNNSNNSGDFMNKKWLLPTVEMLKEFYRVLKTGGFFVTTFTPRQDLQTVFIYRLMEAGFDVSFSPIYWAYKQGFPKASNYSKVMQKQGYNNEAQYCDGLYSLSLKPALEPILIAQKPHNKAKYKQALDWYYERKELLDKGIKEEDLSLYTKNASGGCWIDNARIPSVNNEHFRGVVNKVENNLSVHDTFKTRVNNTFIATDSPNGRFPANLLCGFAISKEELRSEYPDATEEELEKMVNMIENPLDVGRVSKSEGRNVKENELLTGNVVKPKNRVGSDINDQGDLSRYFSLTAWSKKHFPNLHNIAEKTLQLQEDVKKTGDCLFVCKPAQSEKNAGLDGFGKKQITDGCIRTNQETARKYGANPSIKQNTHPTTKPIALYNYLLSIFSRDGDVILDPFCGSGATPISCVLTNRRYIGIEMSAEYHKIAEARVEYWKQQKEGVKSASASKKNISASRSIDTKQETLL